MRRLTGFGSGICFCSSFGRCNSIALGLGAGLAGAEAPDVASCLGVGRRCRFRNSLGEGKGVTLGLGAGLAGAETPDVASCLGVGRGLWAWHRARERFSGRVSSSLQFGARLAGAIAELVVSWRCDGRCSCVGRGDSYKSAEKD